MARLSNPHGANDNGKPTWQETRRADAYGESTDTDDDDGDES